VRVNVIQLTEFVEPIMDMSQQHTIK